MVNQTSGERTDPLRREARWPRTWLVWSGAFFITNWNMHHHNCIRSDGDWICAGGCTHDADAELARLRQVEKAAKRAVFDYCACASAPVEILATLGMELARLES